MDLQGRLQKHQEAGLYRQRRLLSSPQTPEQCVDGQSLIGFCSNDYLGLANHPKVIEAMVTAAQRYGVGAGASHLVNGHHETHHDLETALAEFLGYPSVLLFSTGYMANTGTLNALLDRKSLVVQDRLNHASLLDGGLSSGATFKRFNHGDYSHLDQQLSGDSPQKWAVTDGIFSMDGDQADLRRMANVCAKHNAGLMVDDAHGIGVCGPNGRGTVAQQGLGVTEVPVLVGTLGKACGTFGAFVAGSEQLTDALVQFARPYIYTTALPPAVAAASLTALQLLAQADEARAHLQQLQSRLPQELTAMGYHLWDSVSPIQPVMIGDAAQAMAYSDALLKRGLLVTAIRPPTVPKHTARLRVTLSASHTNQQLDQLLQAFYDLRHLDRSYHGA